MTSALISLLVAPSSFIRSTTRPLTTKNSKVPVACEAPMYPGVELRLYRYVVVLAEELNFTRAALRLHVAQPSLSKQIRELENYLGAQVFERTKREVRLTAAGEAFAAEARLTLFHAVRAGEA